MDPAFSLQLVSTALTIADKLFEVDAHAADELRETALVYRSRVLEFKAYTTSSKVGTALVEALERQMERDSYIFQRTLERCERRLRIEG